MSARSVTSSLFWIVALLPIAAGCGEDTPPSAPVRLIQGIRPGIPVSVTDCNSAPCLCEEYPTAYEASVQAYHPTDYAGDGARLIDIQVPGTALVHIWPATACGDSMAAYAVTIGCPICLNISRDTEPEMLNRTFSIWPSPVTHKVLFHARTGLDYWVHQDDRTPVHLGPTATSIEIP
ncbi:MAG TPA: hypothetical protein VF720_15510 [Candidatus Eisenbacteria bacterium]